MENYSPSVIKEFAEKLQETVESANNIAVLGYAKILIDKKKELTSLDMNLILNEMQDQIRENPINTEKVLGKNFEYFKGCLINRSIHKIAGAIRDTFNRIKLQGEDKLLKNAIALTETPSSFKETITAAAAKKLTEDNLDPHAAICGVEQSILKACAAGKYRAIYEINNPTILARLRNRFGGAGFKTEVLGDNHALALSWD